MLLQRGVGAGVGLQAGHRVGIGQPLLQHLPAQIRAVHPPGDVLTAGNAGNEIIFILLDPGGGHLTGHNDRLTEHRVKDTRDHLHRRAEVDATAAIQSGELGHIIGQFQRGLLIERHGAELDVDVSGAFQILRRGFDTDRTARHAGRHHVVHIGLHMQPEQVNDLLKGHDGAFPQVLKIHPAAVGIDLLAANKKAVHVLADHLHGFQRAQIHARHLQEAGTGAAGAGVPGTRQLRAWGDPAAVAHRPFIGWETAQLRHRHGAVFDLLQAELLGEHDLRNAA